MTPPFDKGRRGGFAVVYERPLTPALSRKGRGCRLAPVAHHRSRPNNPAGRTSSTSAMITNTTVDDASG